MKFLDYKFACIKVIIIIFISLTMIIHQTNKIFAAKTQDVNIVSPVPLPVNVQGTTNVEVTKPIQIQGTTKVEVTNFADQNSENNASSFQRQFNFTIASNTNSGQDSSIVIPDGKTLNIEFISIQMTYPDIARHGSSSAFLITTPNTDNNSNTTHMIPILGAAVVDNPTQQQLFFSTNQIMIPSGSGQIRIEALRPSVSSSLGLEIECKGSIAGHIYSAN